MITYKTNLKGQVEIWRVLFVYVFDYSPFGDKHNYEDFLIKQYCESLKDVS